MEKKCVRKKKLLRFWKEIKCVREGKKTTGKEKKSVVSIVFSLKEVELNPFSLYSESL